mmetsp:Transcript_10017/g.29907  ORF Transcript_10017/g.29907 Transcript_10017/m.29907 type:complete len:576 (+) Transcript_10017:90-1817(+)
MWRVWRALPRLQRYSLTIARGFAYEDTLAFRLYGPKPLAIVIHPVVPGTGPRIPASQYLLDAEEALNLARANRWDLLPGPNTEPRGGWDADALIQAEDREALRWATSRARLAPEGWHLDRGEEESDDELDVEEEAWKDPVIRRQWAETCIVKVRQIAPNTFFGKGKVAELAVYVAKNPCRFVFVNTTLTPAQTRNLENIFTNAVAAADAKTRRDEERMNRGKLPPPVHVFDRYRLVLEIFSLRAKTPAAKVQVGLAKLEYMKTRLTVGTRAKLAEALQALHEQIGPFREVQSPSGVVVQHHYEEKPFETERVLLRIAERRLKKMLDKEKKTRILHRKGREGVPLIGLVGYTNVGKTTLMNRLTGSKLKERDIFFQTLETTMRRVHLPSGNHAIVADSIGFLQDLPHGLFAAFEATLEELANCDILIHVRDMSHPQSLMQKEAVLQALEGAGVPREKIEASMVEVWNKIDLLPSLDYVPPEAIPICAADGTGVSDLLCVVDAVIGAQLSRQRRTVRFPESQMSQVLDFLRRYGTVDGETLSVQEHEGSSVVCIDAVLPAAAWKHWGAKFRNLLPQG